MILAEFPRVFAAVLRSALEESGLRVEEVATSAEALRRVHRRPVPTVLLLPSAPAGVLDAWVRVLRANAGLRLLSVSTSPRRADVIELRLVGRDVGRRAIVDAVQNALSDQSS